jgi:hypothetical protein
VERGAAFPYCTLRDTDRMGTDDSAFVEGHFCGREILPHFDASLARGWLDTCLSSHQCQEMAKYCAETGPGRLIEVSQSSEGTRARLVSCGKTKRFEYAALSYRWSQRKDHVTVARNLQAHRDSIPLDTLPATIRDAVSITNALDLKYLWVDCLCIVQDSQRDWEEECVKMSAIYANAAVTLADVGMHGDGLLRRGLSLSYPNSDSCGLRYSNSHGSPVGTVTVRFIKSDKYSGQYHTRPNLSPLDGRGWTLQERVLSSRVLFFGDEKMWWQCSSDLWLETLQMRSKLVDIGDNHLSKRPLYSRQPELIYRWWYDVLVSYGRRALNFPMDILPAVSGIASFVQGLTGDVYLCGLWQHDLARGLMWYSNYSAEGNPVNLNIPFRGPSWSWARSDTVRATPAFEEGCDRHVEPFVTFVSAQITPEGGDPFGRVSRNCSLTIKAPARSTKVSRIIDERHSRTWALGSRFDGSQDADLEVFPDAMFPPRGSDKDIEESDFLAVHISTVVTEDKRPRYSSRGLLLRRERGKYYRRIATIQSSWSDGVRKPTQMDRFSSVARTQTLTLI